MSIPKTEKTKSCQLTEANLISNLIFHISWWCRGTFFRKKKHTYNACFTKNEKKEKHTHKSCFQRENGTIWNNWNKIEHVSFAACGDRRKKKSKKSKKKCLFSCPPLFSSLLELCVTFVKNDEGVSKWQMYRILWPGQHWWFKYCQVEKKKMRKLKS